MPINSNMTDSAQKPLKETPAKNWYGGLFAFISIGFLALSLVTASLAYYRTNPAAAAKWQNNELKRGLEKDSSPEVAVEPNSFSILADYDDPFDARRIAADIQTNVYLYFAVPIFAISAIIFCGLAMWPGRYRSLWFYWVSWFFTLLLAVIVPIGTLVAIFFATHLIRRRGEYFARSA